MAIPYTYKVRSNTLQKRLFADLEKGTFTDVTFKVGPDENPRIFKAHRLILASENPEFEKILYRPGSEEIMIFDVHPKGFENLIRYCYGESFGFKDLEAIRHTCLAAEKYKAPKLQLTAENYLIELLKTENVIEILKVCIELNMPRAKERCLEKISSRFDKVLMSEELALAPFKVLAPILRLSLDHGSEFNIYVQFTVLEWAKAHECPSDIISKLLSFIGYGTGQDGSSFIKRNCGQFTGSQKRAINFIRSEVESLLKNPLVFPPTIKKEPETSLKQKEEIKLTLQVSESNDKDTVGLKEASTLNGDVTNDADYDSDVENLVIEEKIIADLIKEADEMINDSVNKSKEETVNCIVEAAKRVTEHASDTMQIVVDEFMDSFKCLTS